MRVTPLTGQVLIEVLPTETRSAGGVELPPDLTLSAEIVQESHANPEKPAKNHIGIVRAIGPWPKTRSGLIQMPEFGIGAKVVFNPFRGTAMQRGIGEHLRMVRNDDVLAVLL